QRGVVCGVEVARAGLSESRDRGVDQFGMRLLERRVIQAKTGERSGSEVLDDDVGLIDKAVDCATPVEPLEVEGDAFFVTIGAREVGALASHKRRPPRACLIAVSRTFYLDD